MLKTFIVFQLISLFVGDLNGATVFDRVRNNTESDIFGHLTASIVEPESVVLSKPLTPITNNDREQTLLILKPDALQRKLVGEIIGRFEGRGLKLVAMKMIMATKPIVEEHYKAHNRRSFYEELVNYMTSAPIIPMVWEGADIVKITRSMIGTYDQQHPKNGTIRGDFAIDFTQNLIHGSDSSESANTEIKRWFQQSELITT